MDGINERRVVGLPRALIANEIAAAAGVSLPSPLIGILPRPGRSGETQQDPI